jgi:hypothetical protein
MRRVFIKLGAMILACVSLASASATLLLEEPYGKMGFFTATGHAAVYLSGVCAETPLVLRHCAPGETGIVLSRYDGVGGHDWLAIPLIPYLYAVERPEDVPLFATSKTAAFLRDRYRRKYLEDIAPDVRNGETPGGNWYQLVGSSYDRTIYGFEIETTRDQDDALIRAYNASPNKSHFHLVSNNCADFAKHVLNFYYPKSLHRSLVADVGITTPKQIAKTLTKFSARHPELEFSRLIISQVPGSMPRSTNVHGVVESFFKAKKYIVPSAVMSPIFAGCVAAVYVGTGTGHFEPAQNAMVFVAGGDPERPLGREDRRAYQLQLKHFLAGAYPEESGRKAKKIWAKLQSKAKTGIDNQGRPVLEVWTGESRVQMGVSAENVLKGNAPAELEKSTRGISETEVARDWELLQKTMAENVSPANGSPAATRLTSHSENTRGNRP